MQATVLYSGFSSTDTILQTLSTLYNLQTAQTEASRPIISQLHSAELLLIGPGEANAIRRIQQIHEADKQLSIILLTEPYAFKKTKQSLQFAPFIGNNTQVFSIGPELNIAEICSIAINRTRQKRAFRQINLKAPIASTPRGARIEQLGIFLDNAPIGAILFNDDFTIATSNQFARNYFPMLSRSGTTFNDLFVSADLAALRQFIFKDFQSGMRHDVSHGQSILSFTCSEIYNEDGQRLVLALFLDVTNARQESSRIQMILDSLPQMAWTTDATGAVTFFTKSWLHYTGEALDTTATGQWLNIFHSDEQGKFADEWQRNMQTGASFQQAARLKNVTGEFRWHLVKASAICNHLQEIIMWVVTATDVHDQIQLTQELERKVRERTRELERSNSELEQYAHVSSHDLQEPLRKIRTFADLLKDESSGQLNEVSQRYLDKISSTAARMSHSLRSLLEFTALHRLESKQSLDLNKTLSQVLIDLELLIDEKKAVVEVENLPTIKGIPIQLQQLFSNLLSNALKFTVDGRAPLIRITAHQIPAQELHKYPMLQLDQPIFDITVADNGIGFDPKHADKIFSIFQRLHSREQYAGTGIGLSIVKKIAQNHGGLVYADSIPNEGSSFHILLPSF